MTTATHQQMFHSVGRRRSELTSALGTLLERIETDDEDGEVRGSVYDMSPAEVDAMLGMNRKLEALSGHGGGHHVAAASQESTVREGDPEIGPVGGPSSDDEMTALRRHGIFEGTVRMGAAMTAILVPALAAASIATAAMWWTSRGEPSTAVTAPSEQVRMDEPLPGTPGPAWPPTESAAAPSIPVERTDTEVASAVEAALTNSGVVAARVSVVDGAVTVDAVAPADLLADGYFARLGQLERLASVDGAIEVEVRLELRGDAGTLQSTLDEIAESSPILFDSGSAEVHESDSDVLDDVAEAILAQPGLPVVIAGTTDSSGSASTNEELARVRATAVVEELAVRGVPANRLQVVSYGELFAAAGDDARSIRFEVGA